MSKYLDRAHEIRAIVEPHHNCTQSVLMSFTQSLKLDDETAYKIAVAFGAGMKSGLTCGVITGGLMVLGLFGVDDQPTTQKLISDFKEKYPFSVEELNKLSGKKLENYVEATEDLLESIRKHVEQKSVS